MWGLEAWGLQVFWIRSIPRFARAWPCCYLAKLNSAPVTGAASFAAICMTSTCSCSKTSTHFEDLVQGGASEVGLSLEKYLALMADKLLVDLCKVLRTKSCVPAEFKRDWQFSFPLDYTHRHGVRVQTAGGEIEWLQAARDHQKPLNTVCFPSTNMGPDLIVCARAAGSPEDLLVVLIQAKSGVDESTPNAFLSLEKLYQENRGKSSAVPAKFEEYAKSVEDILKQCKVVHLVVKPVNGASTTFLRQSGVVRIVLDKRDSAGNLFPTLAKGMACFRNAKLE